MVGKLVLIDLSTAAGLGKSSCRQIHVSSEIYVTLCIICDIECEINNQLINYVT